jgi:hypothetical protein
MQWFPLRFNASISDGDNASKGKLWCFHISTIFRELHAESKKLARKLEIKGKVATILEIKKLDRCACCLFIVLVIRPHAPHRGSQCVGGGPAKHMLMLTTTGDKVTENVTE